MSPQPDGEPEEAPPGQPGDDAGAADLRAVAELARSEPAPGVDEERRLTALAAAGDRRARERLFRVHSGLAMRLAEERTGQGLEIGDLLQEASAGLADAIAGAQAGGPLAPRVEQVVGRHLDAAIQLERAAEQARTQLVADTEAYERAEIEIRRRAGRSPTEAELAEKLEWSLPRTRRLAELVAGARRHHDEELLAYLNPEDLDVDSPGHDGRSDRGGATGSAAG